MTLPYWVKGAINLTLLLALMSLVTSATSASAGTGAIHTALDSAVRFDNRSFIINGERVLLLSGGVHYARVLPADWERVFTLAREMGLNTIQTYFMWNFHEHKRGNMTWSGRADLAAFVRAAAKAGLFVVLRIGPYICGEYYMGGIPIWMRDAGIKCDRCSDPVWEQEMGRIVGLAVEQVRPLLASNGGPIIMLQVENEYGGSDFPYLKWSVDMANKLTVGESVPWILCHDHAACAKINRDENTGEYDFKAICTINGFWMDEYTQNPGQPSPKWASDQYDNNPGQPLAWTEDQGWFDQWGKAQRVRESADQLYGVARHTAFGGSYHNHYMMTGGNNYGLQSGGEVVTAYAPDTVIDYLLLRKQPRYNYYTGFYKTLDSISAELLAHPVTSGSELPSNASSGSNSSSSSTPLPTSLLHCTDDDPAHIGRLDAAQQWHFLPSSTTMAGLSFFSSDGTDKQQQGQLQSVDNPHLCLDSQKSHLPPMVTPCAANKESQMWVLDTAATQIRSVSTGPCMRKGASGQCHYCLDDGSGTKLQLWDCKGPNDNMKENQYFYLDSKESGIFANASTDNCVTLQQSTQGGRLEVHEYGSAVFISNTATDTWLAGKYGDRTYVLRPHAVQIINATTGAVLYDTGAAVDPPIPQRGVEAHVRTSVPRTTPWSVYTEEVGAGTRTFTSVSGPHEQLNLTDNDSDYLWYTTSLPTGTKPGAAVSAQGGSESIVYPTVDAAAGKLHILSAAMGASNGGQIRDVQKGVHGKVTVGGKDVTQQAWTHSWFMLGEAKQIFTPGGVDRVSWSPLTPKAEQTALTWYRAAFDLPKQQQQQQQQQYNSSSSSSSSSDGDDVGDPQPPQIAYALDLKTMWKGQAYVNGFHLGRYYLLPGQCSGTCAPPIKNGHCYMHWKDCGKPTQYMYHVPTSVLKPTGNLVVLFEEAAAPNGTTRSLEGVQLVQLSEHPQM